jgi:hypothetical protein
MNWFEINERFIEDQRGKLQLCGRHWQDSAGKRLSNVEVNAMLVAAGCHPKVAARTRKFLEPAFAQPLTHPPAAVIERLAGKLFFSAKHRWWKTEDGTHLFDREVDRMLRDVTGQRRPQAIRRQLETYWIFLTNRSPSTNGQKEAS